MFGKGEVLNKRFEVLGLLGRGAFGTTYQVHDLVFARVGALKVSHQHGDGPWRLRWLREARAMADMTHPNIVQLFEVQDLDGRLGLLMEFVRGMDLEGALKRQPWAVASVLETALAVGKGLTYAHGRQVIHRDVKPANVLVPIDDAGLLRRSEAKLSDFGLAQVLSDESEGVLAGTPVYMAPEQLRDLRADARTDVYSFGVLIYRMLFRDLPFGNGPSRYTLEAIARGQFDIPDTRPDAPRALPALIRRMMSHDPKRRPALSEVVATLELIQVGVRREAPARVVGGRSVDRSRSRRTRFVKALFLVALCVALGFGAREMSKRDSTVRLSVGLFLLGTGLGALAAIGVRRMIGRRQSSLDVQAGTLLGRAGGRDVLSRSLAVDLDQLLEECRRLDHRILAQSLIIMIDEYQEAKESNNRQAAVMNAVVLLEKLMSHLSPWYVRHEKLIAISVSISGALAGLVSAAAAMGKK